MAKFRLLALLLLLPALAFGGTVTGVINTATSGPVKNGALTFVLTQSAVQTGTATIVSTPVSCYTDASGNVVGEPNPVVVPSVSTNTSSGTLAAGTYYSKITLYDASGETAVSPEQTTVLSSQGTLIFAVPGVQPATATGWKIYIGATSGAETLQSTQVGFAAGYSQSTSLVSGAALPSSNTTACKILFNDQLIPSFTGYTVTLHNSSGSSISGFPQKWYLQGGASGTVNLSSGTPLYSGIVQYPQAIVSNPASNGLQSINGPLSLGAYAFSSTNSNNAGYDKFTEIAAPACATGFDFIWGDSTAHRLKECANGGSAANFTQDTGLTTGQVPKANASGVLVPSGATDDGTTFAISELVTTRGFNGALVVGSGTNQFSSMAACYSAASVGQTCLVSPNWSETFTSQLVMSKNNVGFFFLGAASINMSTFGIAVSNSVIGAYLFSPSAFGGAPTDTGSGTPVNLAYSGSGAAITVGSVGDSVGVLAFGLQNVNIDISAGTSATGINAFCLNHAYISGLSIIGTNGANTQTGLKISDCGVTGSGANTINGLQIIRPKFAIQLNGNMRESDFGGLRLAGLLVSPIAGSIGIDFQSNAKNNFIHGGFVSGYITAINFGGTSNFNDIHIAEDLDSGGGGAQDVVFGSGTTNNEVTRTSDIGAIVFTDSGNGNCVHNTGSQCVVKRVDTTGLGADVGSTTLYTVPANTGIINLGGMYRVSCYAVVTRQATTTSTLPNIQIQWTDSDSNTLTSFINCTANSTGTANPAVGFSSLNGTGVAAGVGDNPTINVGANGTINYKTVSYATSGATSMQFALHIKVEYLGQ